MEGVRIQGVGCPFLRWVMSDRVWMYPTEVYCRYPSGRVRIPARETVEKFCASGHYDDCAVYNRLRSKQDLTGVA